MHLFVGYFSYPLISQLFSVCVGCGFGAWGEEVTERLSV